MKKIKKIKIHPGKEITGYQLMCINAIEDLIDNQIELEDRIKKLELEKIRKENHKKATELLK